ncbi:MAG: acyl-CoA dehydratase activase [Dissulfurispiraceae bacterium]
MNFIGVDAGSVAIKCVVLNSHGNKLEGRHVKHYGHPLSASLTLLKEVKELYPESGLSLTGSAAKVIASVLKIKYINEIVSQAYSIRKLFPRINTIIEMGGEDSKLILLEGGQIRDFSMNSVCAAGTGSFLEQQAERLRLKIEEFSEMSVLSARPSKIAGRCSVFAKSDMIHLQQIATPMEDIVSGLCFAVARNFKSSIAKGRELKAPVAFQGGVAANKGMVRAFKEVFELDELFVPEDFVFMGALGAALKDMDEFRVNDYDPGALEAFLAAARFEDQGHQPLSSGITSGDRKFCSSSLITGRTGAYLGIDIGSISTNLALVDEDGALIAKRYLMTAGRPIDAVMRGLDEIYADVGDNIQILGAGTTGSGRYMIADYVGADIVKNEITAQATAAIFINPAVDTIFEIGGQDSKYISIRDGVIVDFEMNKACAAGTGSFLEEQAEKLGIPVKDEFAALAFNSGRPCRLGERCTVFMENSLMANLQKGAAKDDLLAGLAYSIVQNYVNRVIAGKPIGKNIFFQGGVAFNKAVVAAFENYIGAEITVPPNHDVTGAIGMALIAMRHMKRLPAAEQRTRFKGFSLSTRPYEVTSFECKGCSNVCEINRVGIQGEEGHLFYGGRCERYDIRRSRNPALPDPYEYRQDMLWKSHQMRTEQEARENPDAETRRRGDTGKRLHPKVKIGVPYIFFFHDYLPFWTDFLWELGFEVIVSPKTNKQIVQLGVDNVLSEACFPVKVAHGHIKYLMDAGIDALFIPSFIDMSQSGKDYPTGLACPHTQTIPYVSKAAIRGAGRITPIVDFSRGMDYLKRELHRGLKQFGIRRRDIDRAMVSARTAQETFSASLESRGRELLAQFSSANHAAVVIIGRSYNAFDPEVNLGIPKKLSAINTLSIPMDMLPLEDIRMQDSWPNMYWRSGH